MGVIDSYRKETDFRERLERAFADRGGLKEFERRMKSRDGGVQCDTFIRWGLAYAVQVAEETGSAEMGGEAVKEFVARYFRELNETDKEFVAAMLFGRWAEVGVKAGQF